jgi:hypothetical protein
LPKLKAAAEKLTGAPVPVNATVCGLLLALSLMLIVAVRVPAACGEKVTEIVQWDFAARLPPQVFACTKSPGSAPVNVMPLIVNGVERLLVRVTLTGALVVPPFCAPNVKEVDDTVTWAMPVPLNAAVCGLFEAASVTVSVPVSPPMMLGVNVIVMKQLPLAATLPLQGLVSVKSGLPVVMLEIMSGTASALDNLMTCEVLEVF